MSQYDYNIEFKPTKDHGNADMLSRLPLKTQTRENEDTTIYRIQVASLPVSVEQIKIETENDIILSNVLQFLKTNSWPKDLGIQYRPYYDKRDELSLEHDVILWGLRVVIPSSLRCKVLEELHAQHPGIVRMKSLSRIHVYYPGIDKDIEQLVQQCEICTRVANNPPKSVAHPWAWPKAAMDRIHMDYFQYDNTMYLIMVDSYSKWIDVKVMTKTNTRSTINCLEHWFSVYGLPHQIVTDNGSQFTSVEFATYVTNNGIKHICTPAYHQSTNGQVERYVQTVKRGLKSARYAGGDAQAKLDNYMMSYRSTPSTVTEVTPALLFLGRQLNSKLTLVHPNEGKMKIKSLSDDQQKHVRRFEIGDKVKVRMYIKNQKWADGVIEKTIG